MSYRDPLAQFSLRCPNCKGNRLTSNNRREHKCLDCLTRCTDETALPSEAREKFIKKMPNAIIIWKQNDRGRDYRMCLLCMLYVNSKYEPDASLYTPAQIKKFEEIPAEKKCDHMKKKEEKW